MHTRSVITSLFVASGSARFNAEQMTRTVQARIEKNKTSQGVVGSGLAYSREPNRKNSIFIGNLTWVYKLYELRSQLYVYCKNSLTGIIMIVCSNVSLCS